MIEMILLACLMIGTVVFFYKAGEADLDAGLWWTGISLILWLVALFVLGWGVVGGTALQVALAVLLILRHRWESRQPVDSPAPLQE